eukprot:TRINITY_DN67442_c2_g4_i1.p1 TRINITY_DN67442_c2_g4~~TRINITY_DN67442_c2_g4_i1.p1  ORF type:complete len:428 (-),score=28.43 TRINITY_DN67442_c2_g4_i1:85-1302(-)
MVKDTLMIVLIVVSYVRTVDTAYFEAVTKCPKDEAVIETLCLDEQQTEPLSYYCCAIVERNCGCQLGGTTTRQADAFASGRCPTGFEVCQEPGCLVPTRIGVRYTATCCGVSGGAQLTWTNTSCSPQADLPLVKSSSGATRELLPDNTCHNFPSGWANKITHANGRSEFACMLYVDKYCQGSHIGVMHNGNEWLDIGRRKVDGRNFANEIESYICQKHTSCSAGHVQLFENTNLRGSAKQVGLCQGSNSWSDTSVSSISFIPAQHGICTFYTNEDCSEMPLTLGWSVANIKRYQYKQRSNWKDYDNKIKCGVCHTLENPWGWWEDFGSSLVEGAGDNTTAVEEDSAMVGGKSGSGMKQTVFGFGVGFFIAVVVGVVFVVAILHRQRKQPTIAASGYQTQHEMTAA